LPLEEESHALMKSTEAGHQRIPEFDGLRLWLCRIDK
jgi:hypothetical protein